VKRTPFLSISFFLSFFPLCIASSHRSSLTLFPRTVVAVTKSSFCGCLIRSTYKPQKFAVNQYKYKACKLVTHRAFNSIRSVSTCLSSSSSSSSLILLLLTDESSIASKIGLTLRAGGNCNTKVAMNLCDMDYIISAIQPLCWTLSNGWQCDEIPNPTHRNCCRKIFQHILFQQRSWRCVRVDVFDKFAVSTRAPEIPVEIEPNVVNSPRCFLACQPNRLLDFV
jgi:hypothetical protein